MSDFHEEFEGRAADVAAVPDDAPEPESVHVDVNAGGVGLGHDPAEPAPGAGSDEPEPAVDEAIDGVVTGASEGDVAAQAEDASAAGPAADAEDADPTGAEVDLDALTARAAMADEYLSLAQRTKADFDNFRKRAARDADVAAQRGAIKLAKELLPALDNLERAIAHAASDDPLLEGIKFVLSDLLAALGRAGIESFSPAGESFDPQLHEAVAQHPQAGAEAGTVLEVYQQGYRLADTVLRPARVLVAA